VKRLLSFAAVLAMLAALMLAAPASSATGGAVVVANRASGTISVLDATSGDLLGTYALPDDGEPMYVTATIDGSRVFVGDRANDRVVVFDGDDYSVIGTVAAGAGVFHMWQNPQGRQLWVNNDIDNTSTVINPRTLDVIATVPMPADLVDAGYKPHDVIVDPSGRFAYVTLVGGVTNDWVVQFSTKSFAEVNRAPVGLDPHVSLTNGNKNLYVPAQNSDVVQVLDLRTLQPATEIAVPGAHGAGMNPTGSVFYTTNLPGGGVDGLFAIDTKTNTVIGSAGTSFAVPHNVVVTPNGTLFVTHSGATSDKVTVHAVSNRDPVPSEVAVVTVGLNPFGLAYVP
jgi:YVTN family beta-propeller protein